MAFKQTISKTCTSSALFEGVKIPVQPVVVADLFYIKVEAVNGTKANVNCSVSFIGEKVRFQKAYTFEPDLEGGNFIKQAYEHLKTLPEFTGVVDC
jgi:hypothetical protein